MTRCQPLRSVGAFCTGTPTYPGALREVAPAKRRAGTPQTPNTPQDTKIKVVQAKQRRRSSRRCHKAPQDAKIKAVQAKQRAGTPQTLQDTKNKNKCY